MARILINCPQTGTAVDTGNKTEPEWWDFADWGDLALWGCSACGLNHRWSKADAFLEAS